MTTYIIRASHANEFELQNYTPLKETIDLKVVSSLSPLTPISLPTIRLRSPSDLPSFPFKKQLLNRLIGGDQWLLGLDELASIADQPIFHTAETYTPYTHQAVVLKREGKLKKLVCTCWETIPHNNEKFRRLKSWKKQAYEYVDLFHTPTKLAQKALIEEGVDPSKIVVVPYGVKLDRFPPHRPRHQVKNILFVGRLVEEKGVGDLVKAWQALALPELTLTLVGQGNIHPNLPNLKIRTLDYREITTAYQSADIFVLPSHTSPTWEEQYGMVLVEAMASGLPVIASDSGAIKEVLGGNGLLYRSADTDELLRLLTRLINDHALRAKLGSSARAYAESQYDSTKIAKRLSSFYL